MFRYGGAMVIVQFFWFVQSQSDVFIAGRVLSAHELGLYTTALFLTQILTAKFLPPLNEVAFAAYSRIQDDREAVGSSFLKSVRLIMLIALPFYLGFAATAEPLVLTMLGEKWRETIPLAWVLALGHAVRDSAAPPEAGGQCPRETRRGARDRRDGRGDSADRLPGRDAGRHGRSGHGMADRLSDPPHCQRLACAPGDRRQWRRGCSRGASGVRRVQPDGASRARD
jgi:hypothetical protein